MKLRRPLDEYQRQLVRETPQHWWDAETLAKAHDPKPLPIDLAYGMPEDPDPWMQLAPGCWIAALACASAVICAAVILWVVL